MSIYGCVYVIKNIVNGKLYVGQTSATVEFRMDKHWRTARLGKNNGMPLMRAMRKHGKNAFKIVAKYDYDSKEELDLLEVFLIAYLETKNNTKGYNVRDGGWGMGLEDRKRMSSIMKEVYADPQRRAELSERTKKQMADPVQKEANRKTMIDFWADPKNKQMMGDKIKSAQSRPEVKERMCKAQKEVAKRSGETERRREVSRIMWSDENKVKEIRKAISLSLSSPEVRKKLKETTDRQWREPERRAKIYGNLKIAQRRIQIERYGNQKIDIYNSNEEKTSIFRYDLLNFCKEHGLQTGNAVKVLEGKIKQTGGFVFRLSPEVG